MRTPLTFTAIEAGDAELLVTFSRAMNAEDGHPLSREGEAAARNVAAGEPLAPCWIIRAGPRAVGYVVLTLGYSIENGGRDAFLDELYLVGEERGGRGEELMAFVESAARDLQARAIYLEVSAGNARAAALYRSRGFAELSEGRRLMRLPLAPAPQSV
jgi:ribosomal protein S18 acetylase RimI-like enzyme